MWVIDTHACRTWWSSIFFMSYANAVFVLWAGGSQCYVWSLRRHKTQHRQKTSHDNIQESHATQTKNRDATQTKHICETQAKNRYVTVIANERQLGLFQPTFRKCAPVRGNSIAGTNFGSPTCSSKQIDSTPNFSHRRHQEHFLKCRIAFHFCQHCLHVVRDQRLGHVLIAIRA